MDIQLLNVSVEANIPTKNGKGTYDKLIVTYKNLNNNKVEAKQIFPFGMDRALFQRIKDLEPNQTYHVTQEKGDSGYWEWRDVSRQDAPVQGTTNVANTTNRGPAAVPTAGRPQYETHDERAKKQVYIIKQSSLSNAIEFLNAKNSKATVEEVLEIAQTFTDWVLQDARPQMGDKQPSLDEMEDDIPY